MAVIYGASRVFPAYAGMIRTVPLKLTNARKRVPRLRGDDPVSGRFIR